MVFARRITKRNGARRWGEGRSSTSNQTPGRVQTKDALNIYTDGPSYSSTGVGAVGFP